MIVLPRLSALMGDVIQPLKSTQRRQLLAAVGEMQRCVWLLECNLQSRDRLALLKSLEASADTIDRLLT